MLYFLKLCPIFVGSFHNFGKSDDDKIYWKNAYFHGFMSNLIKKSLKDSSPTAHLDKWKPYRPRAMPVLTAFQTRGVVPGGAVGAMTPPDFGRSVNPISTRGTDYAHLITTVTPEFSDTPTALQTDMETTI